MTDHKSVDSNEDTTQTESNVNGDLERLSQFREWLLKSNGRILGPFSHEEVEQQLRDKIFVPHDEIIFPRGRWKLLRHEDKFKDVINELRNLQHSKAEKTHGLTGSITINEITQSDDVTGTVTAPGAQGSESVREVPAAGERVATPLPVDTSRDLVKAYSYENDPKSKKRSNKTENIKIGAALFIFLIAGLFSLQKLSHKSDTGNATRADSYQDLLEMGDKAQEVGDYNQALNFYSDARNIKPNENELLYRMAPLTFIFEKQSLQASRMFKQILESNPTPAQKKGALMGQGLVALESHELDIAMENFSLVLSMDPQNSAALFNIGIVNFYRYKFDTAEDYLEKALEKGGSDGAVVLSMAHVNVASSEEGSNAGTSPEKKKRLPAAHGMMQAFLDLAFDYKAQVYIQDAYVLTLMGRPQQATKNLEAVLDLDPEQSDLFLETGSIFVEELHGTKLRRS